MALHHVYVAFLLHPSHFHDLRAPFISYYVSCQATAPPRAFLQCASHRRGYADSLCLEIQPPEDDVAPGGATSSGPLLIRVFLFNYLYFVFYNLTLYLIWPYLL